MSAYLEGITMDILDDPGADISWLIDETRYAGLPEKEAEFHRQDDVARYEDYGHTWSMIGLRAKAVVHIPHGDGFIGETIASPGLWGLESDTPDEYRQKVFEAEKAVLLDMLKQLNIAV